MISGILDFASLYKVVICWVLTPIGGMVLSWVFYHLISKVFKKVLMDLRRRNIFLRGAVIFAGCYGAYSLGANNVANVTGVYVGSGLLTPFQASLFGSLCIASGVLTYSKKVMNTVGKRIVHLDDFSAFVSGLSAAITVHLFTQVGVPVSSSQAIVGGVTGVGLVKGAKTVRKRTLIEIGVGWVCTPLFCALIAYYIMRIYLSLAGTGA
jgi:PiT family inorganic phosphate transporter